MRRFCAVLLSALLGSCASEALQPKKIRLPLTRLTEQTDLLQVNLALLSTAMVGRQAGGYGTSFCVDYNLMLTNHHVVYYEEKKRYHDGIELVFFTLEPNGHLLRELVRVPVKVVRADEVHDLALLTPTDGTFICRPLHLSEEEPVSADFVWRFGFNDGWRLAHGVYRQTTDFSTSENPELQLHGRMYKFEIHDGPGASGGPLFNLKGSVVGVTTRFRRDVEVYEEESSGELRIKVHHYVFSPTLETLRNFVSSGENGTKK